MPGMYGCYGQWHSGKWKRLPSTPQIDHTTASAAGSADGGYEIAFRKGVGNANFRPSADVVCLKIYADFRTANVID